MSDKSKPYCPACETVLRVQTYEEIIEEIMKKMSCSRSMANLMFVPYVGALTRWWCEKCEKPISSYSLMNQIFSVRPMENDSDG